MNSQIGSYFAVKLFFVKIARVSKAITTIKREDAEKFVDKPLKVLQDVQSDIFKILDKRMAQLTQQRKQFCLETY